MAPPGAEDGKRHNRSLENQSRPKNNASSSEDFPVAARTLKDGERRGSALSKGERKEKWEERSHAKQLTKYRSRNNDNFLRGVISLARTYDLEAEDHLGFEDAIVIA